MDVLLRTRLQTIMKKTFTLLIAMLAALACLKASAAIYIVGNDPFGDWNPGAGVQMNDEGDGIYSFSTAINGSVYFVFADGLDSDWNTFNNNYRIGPDSGDKTVTPGLWIETHKAGDHGAYLFIGSGEVYTFTYDSNSMKFRVEGYVGPPLPLFLYTVVGSPSVFGSSWDCTDESNDMVKGNNGLYTWSRENVSLVEDFFEFKIVGNHDWANEWPQGFGNNWVAYVPMVGIYHIDITFDEESKEINCTLVKSGDITPEPTFGDLNGDGTVNISDINIIIFSIINDEQDMDYDLNGDGTVNISDVTLLIDCILEDHTPVTRTPVASLERKGAELWCNIQGEGDIYVDNELQGTAPVNFLVATQTRDDQQGSFAVWAQASGKQASETIQVSWQLEALPVEVATTPVISYDEETLTVTATSPDNVCLFIDGVQVSGNRYKFEQTTEDVTYKVSAYAYAIGKEDSPWAYMDIEVPALEPQVINTCFGQLAQVSEQAPVRFIHDATVLWQYGYYIYAMDETGYGLIYGDVEEQYLQGDVIPAGFGGKKITYMHEPEVMYPTGLQQPIGHVDVTPQVITTDDVNHQHWAQYVVINNVTIAQEDDPTHPGLRVITDEDDNTAYIYNLKFYTQLPEDLSINYNIYGIVGSFDSPQYELLPISFEPVTAAHEMTPAPTAELVRTGPELWCNITGEGDIYVDNELMGSAPVSFLIATQTDEYQHDSFSVRAIAPGKEPSNPITVHWELEARPTVGFSFADMLETADGKQVVFTHDATVVWQHRYYLFAMDDTGFGLIYGDTGQSYKQGDVIPAGFGGKKMLYMGEPEIQNPTGFQPPINNVSVSPLVISIDDIDHPLWSHYVVVKNVTIGDKDEAYGIRTITDADGNTGSIYSGTFFIDLPDDLSQRYDIYGVINSYKSTYQLLPTQFVPAQ